MESFKKDSPPAKALATANKSLLDALAAENAFETEFAEFTLATNFLPKAFPSARRARTSASASFNSFKTPPALPEYSSLEANSKLAIESSSGWNEASTAASALASASAPREKHLYENQL
jgi:hypothetical protein